MSADDVPPAPQAGLQKPSPLVLDGQEEADHTVLSDTMSPVDEESPIEHEPEEDEGYTSDTSSREYRSSFEDVEPSPSLHGAGTFGVRTPQQSANGDNDSSNFSSPANQALSSGEIPSKDAAAQRDGDGDENGQLTRSAEDPQNRHPRQGSSVLDMISPLALPVTGLEPHTRMPEIGRAHV